MKQFQYTQEMIDKINVYMDFDHLRRYDFSLNEDKQIAKDVAIAAHTHPPSLYWRTMAVMILDAITYIEYLEEQLNED